MPTKNPLFADIKKTFIQLGVDSPSPKAASEFCAFLESEFSSALDSEIAKSFSKVWPTDRIGMQYGWPLRPPSIIRLLGGAGIQELLNEPANQLLRTRLKKARLLLVGYDHACSHITLDLDAALGSKVHIVFFDESNQHPRASLRRSDLCNKTGMNIVEFLRVAIDDVDFELL